MTTLALILALAIFSGQSAHAAAKARPGDDERCRRTELPAGYFECHKATTDEGDCEKDDRGDHCRFVTDATRRRTPIINTESTGAR